MQVRYDDVMLQLGYAVFETQETEATLHLAVSVVFGLSEAESIAKLRTVYAGKTIGQFLALIRAKVGIQEALDKLVIDYVGKRNFMVHNISRSSVFC